MDVRLPKLGEGAESGTVVAILVKEGDTIAKGQTILELENEKAVAPIPSTVAGTVASIRVKEGDKISVGHVILTVDESGGGTDAASGKDRLLTSAATRDADREEASETPHEERRSAPEETGPSEEPEPAKSGPTPAASPSIRKIARELGIDLSRVRGSEHGGRIVLADVRAYIQRLQKLALQPKALSAPTAAAPPAEQIDFSKWGPITRKPISPLRKIISERMTENWTSIPHVTQFDEADVTTISGLRTKYAAVYEEKGVRLKLTSFVLKAVVNTLQKHPVFNTSFDAAAGEIVFKTYFHLGLAVDTEQGLIVPVIRDVDKKSLQEISKDVSDLAEKARNRKVSLEELKGGTFTISNQGGIGGAHFTPIINKPEVAILGLGRGAPKAVVRGQKIEPRLMLPLALSYDHRVIDGGSAARFMVDLVGALEHFPEHEIKV